MTPSGMDTQDPYGRHWRAVRRRYYVVLIMFLGFVPTGVLAETLEARVWPGHKTIQSLTFAAYGVCFFVLYARAKRVICPRCSKVFTAKGLWYNDFALRCLHCGLPRGATIAEAENGTYLVPEFSWARVLRLVLAGVEMLLGVVWLGLYLKFGSPLRAAGNTFWVTGAIAFSLSGIVLMLPTRSRWWLQLLPLSWTVLAYVGGTR